MGFLARLLTRINIIEFQNSEDTAIFEETMTVDSLPRDSQVLLNPSQNSENYIDIEKKISPAKTKIDLNRADINELMSLSGVGPVLANAIIEYRKTHGLFKNSTDLINVKGIGAKKLEKIAPFIEIKNGK